MGSSQPAVMTSLQECDNGWGLLPRCPGAYCGRTFTMVENQSLMGDCGACWRGTYRASAGCSECVQCTGSPSLYSWFFLLFMAGLSLALNLYYTEKTNPKKTLWLFLLHLSAVMETVFAAVVTLLVFEPVGTFQLVSCPSNDLRDWYTMFHNPYNVTNNVATHFETLHCTQERVYPLYSLVLVFYGFCLVFLLLFRPLVSTFFVQGKGRKSTYAALYFYPILIGVHAVAGGLIYFCYPYLTLVLSLVTSVIHWAFRTEAERSRRHAMAGWLILETLKDPRNLAIVLGHWVAHGFGILTILVARLETPSASTDMGRLIPYLPILATVPLPSLFFLITVQFTDPRVIQGT